MAHRPHLLFRQQYPRRACCRRADGGVRSPSDNVPSLPTAEERRTSRDGCLPGSLNRGRARVGMIRSAITSTPAASSGPTSPRGWWLGPKGVRPGYGACKSPYADAVPPVYGAGLRHPRMVKDAERSNPMASPRVQNGAGEPQGTLREVWGEMPEEAKALL